MTLRERYAQVDWDACTPEGTRLSREVRRIARQGHENAVFQLAHDRDRIGRNSRAMRRSEKRQ